MKKILVVVALFSFSKGFARQPQPGLLSAAEKNAIVYMWEEEKLARDVYDSLYVKWGGNPFGNIRQSERVHMDRMLQLITRYDLSDRVDVHKAQPGLFKNDHLQRYYKELVASGAVSLAGALKAGATIEELDIRDLEERMAQTERKDILETYRFLKQASENHLRAFVRKLKMQGVDYKPVILSGAGFAQIIGSVNVRGM